MNNTDSNPPSEKKDSTVCQPSYVTFKVYFFSFFAAIGSSVPFLTLYFKQLGLNAGYAGLLLGLRNTTEFIIPLWGMIGDKFKIRKFILLASLASFTAGTLLFLTVQPHNQQCIEVRANETKVAPLIFTSEGITLGSQSQLIKFASNDSSALLNNSKSSLFIRKNDETELNKIFFILLTIMLLGQIVGSSVYSMPDAIVVGFLEEKVNQYGSIRVWGEVGVAFGSFATGGMISFYHHTVCGFIVKNYFISFYIFAGLMAFAMCTTVFMKVNYSEQHGQGNFTYSSLIKELLKTHNLIFLLVVPLLGVLFGFHESFGLWYLDDLGANPFMIGLAAGLRYTAASTGYLASSLILNRFGIERPFAICLLLYSAVFMGLSFVQQPWFGVILFSMQGVLYGFGWSSCVVFGGTISLKAGFPAVVQGVISGFHWGLGQGIGIVISGLLVNMFGIPNMYFAYSVTSVVVSLTIVLVYFLKRQGESEEEIDEGYKLIPQNEDSAN